MFVAGLYLKPNDLRLAIQRRSLIIKAIVANAIVIPLIGLGLYSITPMSPQVGVAFLTVTFSFGVPLVLSFVKGFRANIPFVTVLVFVLAIATSITMPVLLRLILPTDFSVLRTFLVTLAFIVFFQLVPLVVGLALGDSEKVRHYTLRPLGIITTVAGFIIIGLVVVVGLALISRVGVWPVISMIILTLSALAVGWLFGGPRLVDRKVLAVNSSLRNFPIGLLLATSVFSNMTDGIGVAIFAAIMIVTVFIFSRLAMRIRERSGQAATDQSSKADETANVGAGGSSKANN
jgi:bile acid:Na+ symporter, BASS family